MKMCVIVCCLLYSSCLIGQDGYATFPALLFSATGNDSRKVNGETPAELATMLTAPYNSEFQKVRSIFSWITSNISYNVRRYHSPRKNHTSYSDPEIDTGALPSLNERVSINILKSREAVCDGYARLFKNLCDHAGIESEIIHGYAKANGRPAKFMSNHAWNSVRIDGHWYLLDATWAAGFLYNGTNEFVSSYNGRYFLADPKEFSNSHYPEDLRWTLLESPPSLWEFKKTPFQYSAVVRRQIVSYFPEHGTLEATVGDSVLIEIESKEIPHHLFVTDQLFIDTVSLGKPGWQAIIKNKGQRKGNKIRYWYPVETAGAEWLHVIYNNEIILRYRLKVKPGVEPIVEDL
jgi:hypothetical protein